MASRCIRLTRIHAIQWFGYCDTFDIHGNLLIAGRTGAGKSVLMDLLQLVLIGDQRARYNAASDGRGHTSGRDKKSYCLCDTQEDVNGVAQYSSTQMNHFAIALVTQILDWLDNRPQQSLALEWIPQSLGLKSHPLP